MDDVREPTPASDDGKKVLRVRVRVGATLEVVGLEGIPWRVSHINTGRGRVSLVPADPSVKLVEDLHPPTILVPVGRGR